MISIDTIVVANEVADNMYQRSELDWDAAKEEKRGFSHQAPLMHSLPQFEASFMDNAFRCQND